jgi:DNA-binding response OmpR family regulator
MEVGVLVAIIGGQAKDEQHLARLATSAGHRLEFFRVGRAEDDVKPRALVFEAHDRIDLAIGALRALRQDPYYDTVGALIALKPTPGDASELPGEFDDFVFQPYSREELQLRLRAIERRRRPAAASCGSTGFEPFEGIQVEEASRTLHFEGRAIQLTAREFALFAHLCQSRGSVLSREHLLLHVWGSRYSGGRRTVDIHVRRLRAKLGSALPIETVRGSGYRLCGARAEPHPGEFASSRRWLLTAPSQRLSGPADIVAHHPGSSTVAAPI